MWKVVALLVAIFALGQFHRASGAVFSPILIDERGLGSSAIGAMVAAMFFANIVGQTPFGSAMDRFGPARALGLALLCCAVGSVLFAIAESYELLLAARILIGVGLAASGAANNIIIAQRFSARDFGYASGLVVTLGSLGGIMGSYPLSVALGAFGWEVVFIAIGLATCGLAAVVFLTAPGPPDRETKTNGRTVSYLSLIKDAEIRRILTLSFVAYAPITAIAGLWGGPYFQSVHGLSADRAGQILLMMFVATMSAGYVFGRLDRSRIRRSRIIFGAVAISAGAPAALALQSSASPVMAAGLLLAMVFFNQFYVPLTAHLRRAAPIEALGRASALFALVAVLAIPLMQATFGFVLEAAVAAGLAEKEGYRIVFAIIAATIAICGLIYAGSNNIDEEQADAG
ncbi:MAG: MFS transporter [Pseudomonadota bacterium]